MKAAALALLALAAPAAAKVYFEEKFTEDWADRWTKSSWKQDSGEAGAFTLTAGKWYADENDKGIQTGPDARFYATTAAFPEAFDNEGKDLVLQFQVKHEQKLDCGGGYIKVLPESSKLDDFSGDTPYSIMFGPDICGATKRVHVIFTYKGTNHLIKKTVPCETDEMSHVYTLVLKPDNSYKFLIDGNEKSAGLLEDDWDMLPPAEIDDPEDKKPEDWVDEARMADPEDEKPEGYDDIPAEIADPEASKPEDWDDEDDGEWEPRMIPNPEYKGPWSPKMIDNPDYKGSWAPKKISNPDYTPDDKMYHYPASKAVGFELWQVKAGTIFDNILVTDDVEYAVQFMEETYGASKEGEKKMYDDILAEENKKLDAEKEAAEAARKALEEEDEYEEDDDDEEAEIKDEL